MSPVETRTVSDDEAGLRLDRWFKRHFPRLTHGKLEKLLRTGQVRLDGKRAKAAARLEGGQAIRIPPLGESALPAEERKKPDVRKSDLRAVRDWVLYQDADVIVLNKPAGLPVQGGSKITRALDPMLEGLQGKGVTERPRLVHRLDKDTSGVLVLACNARAAAFLAENFRSREAAKVYWALCMGVPKPLKGRIDAALVKGMAKGSGERERMIHDEEEGKKAVTYYAVVETAARAASWVALMPVTGRTHQLRAHMALIGCPVVGDGKYGGRESYLAAEGLSRKLHLHARSIVMPHPRGGTINVQAPLPEHMLKSWKFFGFDTKDDGDPFARLKP